jgi:hypothetical protein
MRLREMMRVVCGVFLVGIDMDSMKLSRQMPRICKLRRNYSVTGNAAYDNMASQQITAKKQQGKPGPAIVDMFFI